ncbi:MAG TPA: class I SAM-dependent methyltransferase [Actinophytocola sp.]|uniref:class I SAM-dependent methyltransferase n=1 Tax=Actinophytocola sp. TaxID=1872138 RepID=UPI002DBBF577|nr:class I SAM-dependent methyltransferase [Actinophytocola sp.]HEU5476105.1 class I SAM-dependent methyltransferase [Actinophytocola sp.]
MATGLAPASMWDRQARNWTCLQEARHRPLRRALLGALGPLAAVRLLDVSCGVGLLLREAAERGAWVAGVETAEELLEVARWALPDADLRVGAPDALPYDNGRFDVTTACNAVGYAGNPAGVVAELVRVVRPGGRVAVGDWADPPGSLTRDLLGRLGVAEEVTVLDAGLDRIDGSELDFPVNYPDLGTAWSAMVARGRVRAAIGLAGKAAVYEAFLDVFAPAVRTDGSIRDENTFRYVIAARPL